MHYKVENYKSLKNTGDIEIVPLTIFIGANGTGKSSVLQPLLFLSQTMTNSRDDIGFLSNGEYLNLGNYSDLINRHDIKQKLSILLDFDSKCKTCSMGCLKNKKIKTIEDTNIGDIPPAKYNITFFCGKDNQPELDEIQIYDCLNRLLLSRKIGKNRKYNISFYKEMKYNNINVENKNIYDSIKNHLPQNFIFDDYEIVKSVMNTKENNKRIANIKIEGVIADYLNVISYNKQQVFSNLKKIKYIGPIRREAERLYPYKKENFDDVGRFGENTASILYQNNGSCEKNNELKKWLAKFKFANDYQTIAVTNHPELFSLEFKESGKDFFVNYADSCFGLSQLLPILVQSIYSQSNDINIIEQPELHLNPSLESTLADFFTEMVNKNGSKKRFMIETHSEHFLLRLRTYIKTGQLVNSKVNIYFTENIEGSSVIRKIEVDKDGNFPNNDWPVGFFEQSLAENMMFATAVKQ
jgi:predicted ATPase